MPRKRIRKSPSRIAAEKEIKRIRQFISRTEKRGYHYDVDRLASLIPKFPGRYTPAYARKLKNITPDKLYSSTYAADPETGEVISGTDFRKIERRMSKEQRAEYREIVRGGNVSRETFSADEPRHIDIPASLDMWADTVINRVKEYLLHIPSARLAKSFMDVLNRWEQRGGKVALAQALTDMPMDVKDYLANAMFAAYEKAIFFEQDLINYWPASTEEKDEMLEISAEEMEEFENIT